MLIDGVELRGSDGRRWLLVPWHMTSTSIAGYRPGDLSRLAATGLIRSAMQDPTSARRLATLLAGSVRALTADAVVERIADGWLRLYESIVRSNHSAILGPARDTAPDEQAVAAAAPEQRTRLRVLVVLDDAVPLAGAAVALTGPDGSRAEVFAGGGGEARMDELPSDGLGRAEVRPAKVPRWTGDTRTPIYSEHIFDFPFDGSIVADIPTGARETIVVRRPEIERVDGDGLRFAEGSSLLVPLDADHTPAHALVTALARLQAAPPCRLLIVGHASPDGGATANDKLAARRAAGVHHLLTGARDAWVDLAAQHGSPADVQRLLRHLATTHAWPCEPTRVDGVLDAPARAAVSAFQAHYNATMGGALDVDGVIGVQTLGALFDVQRQEVEFQRVALGLSDAPPAWYTAAGALSAGERIGVHPAIAGSATEDGQRRVDLLLLAPSLAWREDHTIERLYDTARIHPLPTTPVALGPSDLVLTLVDHYGRILADEPYRLFTGEDERVGTSDAGGRVLARGLRGRVARIECSGCMVVLDAKYYDVARRRYALVPASDPAEDEDPGLDVDEPLPALDDDDDPDDEDLDEIDDDDDELED